MKSNTTKLLLATCLITTALWFPTIAKTPAITTPPDTIVQAITLPPTPKEFLGQEIKKQNLTDRDEIILTEVIQCESGWSQFWPDGTVKVSNGNIGLAQINHGAHAAEYEKLGLDPYDPFENLTYAVILYKRGGIKAWQQWSGHCFLPALAKQGIFVDLEKLEGQTGGQCVVFIQEYYDAYDKFSGDAPEIQPNSTMPEVGSAVLTDNHTALIYKIEGEDMFLAESNYHFDEKITIGRILKTSDPAIRGYFKF